MDINTIPNAYWNTFKSRLMTTFLNVRSRPMHALRAPLYAVGKGTKDELPLLQKTTILLQLPDFDQFRIGYYSDPDEIRAAVSHLKNRTADKVDVSTAIDAGSVLTRSQVTPK